MRRKMVSVILTVAMMGTMLAGCGSKAAEQQGSTANTGGESVTEKSNDGKGTADGDNSYTMFMRNTYVDWIKELKWYDAAEANTGIHVEYVEGPDDFNDVYAEVDQRIISKTLPDAVMTKLVQTNVYGPQGAFVDLAPYIKKYAPNLQKYIDDNPDYAALVTDENGAIYGLVKE